MPHLVHCRGAPALDQDAQHHWLTDVRHPRLAANEMTAVF